MAPEKPVIINLRCRLGLDFGSDHKSHFRRFQEASNPPRLRNAVYVDYVGHVFNYAFSDLKENFPNP